MTLQIWNFAVV